MQPPQTLDGRYRVLRELSRGGMGIVYLVEHRATGRRHAAKVMLAQFTQDAVWTDRFLREVRAPASIDSEHVVEVTDAGTAPELQGMPFLVMELLEGSDLGVLLLERGHLTAAEVISLFKQLAVVLERAHALGIVHRDLKPTNLFLHRTREGRTILKVLDFGLATAFGEAFSAPHLTRTGDIMGTPHYMAPEQARGDRARIGPASDVWALGMIAFELVTGQRYWGEANGYEVVAELLKGEWPPPSELVPGLGPAFDAWFRRSCDRDPAQRFTSVRAQVEALATALGVGVPAHNELAPTLVVQVRSHPLPPTAPMTGLAATPTPFVHTAAPANRGAVWLSLSLTLTGVGALAAAIWMTRDDGARETVDGSAHDETELERPDQDEEPEERLPPRAAPPTDRPPGPWVGTSRIQSVDYDEQTTRRTVEARIGEVRSCYLEALKLEPQLRGELVLMLSINEAGRPTTGTMCAKREDTVFPVGLCRCLVAKAKDWQFPAPEDGISSIQYGFFLEPR